MSKQEIILTQEGYDQLVQELEQLKGPKRREVAERLKLAISYGDLKENGEYHAAKDDQAFMETRIKQLETMIRQSRVVYAKDNSKVSVGSTVLLHDQEFDENVEYTVVGQAEADVAQNKISYESPLGKSIMGRKVDDVVEVEAPMGIISYKVLEIK